MNTEERLLVIFIEELCKLRRAAIKIHRELALSCFGTTVTPQLEELEILVSNIDNILYLSRESSIYLKSPSNSSIIKS